MQKLWVMLPCYNEEDNIVPLTEKWFELENQFADAGYEMAVVCIDDKSTDHTAEKILSLTERFPRCTLIRHEQNKGLGGVLNTAFQYFLENGCEGDLCVLMDGDNSHDPVYSVSMLPKIRQGYDVVIASRYCESSEVKGVPSFRQFLSNGAGVFYKLLLGVKGVKDYTCGYRMYTYEIIRKAHKAYGVSIAERRSFACMMEVLYKLSKIGARFAEVPFVLRYDWKRGASKMRVFNTVRESVLTAIALRFG